MLKLLFVLAIAWSVGVVWVSIRRGRLRYRHPFRVGSWVTLTRERDPTQFWLTVALLVVFAVLLLALILTS